jgi:hypothetical protein
MSNAKDIKPHDIPKKPISAGATLLTPINAPRLLSDLGLIAPVLREVAQLDFPRKVFVTSASEIKINTVVDIRREWTLSKEFTFHRFNGEDDLGEHRGKS